MRERSLNTKTAEEVLDVADQLRQLANKYEKFAESMDSPITDKNPNTLQAAIHNLEIHIARLKEG